MDSPHHLVHAAQLGDVGTRVAWRWKSDYYGPTPEFYYRVTPLMADGVLYTTAGIRRTVVAIDATSGETLWMYRLDEGARGTTSPRRSSGRGVSYWRSKSPGEASRILTISPGFQLVALDSHTGQPIPSFGTGGEIVDQLGAFAEAGVQRVYLQLLDMSDLDHLAYFATEVVRQLS